MEYKNKEIRKLNEQNLYDKEKIVKKDSTTALNSPLIFTKKLNTNYKLIPFNVLVNDIGKTKYLPPVAKEWKNTVYNYYYNNNINLPIDDLRINELIKSYFSLYFNHKYLEHKYISRKRKRRSYNKIFVSKAEIKHTSEKAIITLYVFNKERESLLKRVKYLKKVVFSLVKKGKIQQNNSINNFRIVWSKFISKYTNQIIMTENVSEFLLKHEIKDNLKYINKTFFILNNRSLKKIQKIFSTIKRLRLKLSLNTIKFEEKFLNKLANYISKYYGKKVEFNIINLKSVAYNSDIFTEILTLKLRKEKSNPMRRINALLSRVVLPKVNTIIERGRLNKEVDLKLIDNKYKNFNVNFIINELFKVSDKNANFFFKDNLNKLLYSIYYNKDILNKSLISKHILKSKIMEDTTNEPLNLSILNKAYYLRLRNVIFENIKYKNMGGAKLIVKGRLTRRYRADRALYKYKWKGGLKNIDSAFKGFSTVVFRGYLDSNVEKSKAKSKRRIGSFAVRGWFSGK